ncbi:efflux RND transporter periplasmic adaptor subunit [Kaarinaea lacus]
MTKSYSIKRLQGWRKKQHGQPYLPRWICLLIFLVFVVASFNGVAQEKKKGPGRASPVVVVEAKVQELAPVTWVSGTIISLNDARLATEVEGRLKKVANVGTQVKENDVVARIDNTIVQLNIDELKAEVDKQKARLQFLQQEVKRLNRLADQNAAAKTRLEQTQSEREVARNELEISRTRLRRAREELARHQIRAPFSGVISERFMRTGERAAVGDEVVRLIDTVAVEIQARAPLASINFIKEGMTLDAKSDLGVHTAAKLRTIVPVGDERSRLLDLRLDFDNKDWRVGQPVRVALPTAVPRAVMAVPRDALVLRRDGASVFRVKEDNTAEKVAVEIGIAAGDYVEVVGNLNPGDQIVIRGGERLRPGQAVNVMGSSDKPQSASK